MEYTLQDYRLSLIDEPLPRDCIAFEKASRHFRHETLKPVLNDAMDELKKIDIQAASENNQLLVRALMLVSQSLTSALDIINKDETLTSTADAVLVVQAAIETGWIISCEHNGDALLEDAKTVDETQPAWLVPWVSRNILSEYVKAMQIPKA